MPLPSSRMPNSRRGNDATAAIAAFGMLAAPAAVGVANARATSETGDEVEERCVATDDTRVERPGADANHARTAAPPLQVRLSFDVADRTDCGIL